MSSAPPSTLLFLRGFLTPARAYDGLLAPLRDRGVEVLTPEFYGMGGLSGRYTAADEARDALTLLRDRSPDSFAVAGHSRGGQVAWRLGNALTGSPLGSALTSITVIDPVDGSGRAPTAPEAAAESAVFTCPTLIIGAGRGGRCAPTPVNHDAFARSAPAASHVVLADLGHADMLVGPARWFGRRLCGGGTDPDALCAQVSALLVSHVMA
jgi:pimeloyl-ACP methyl ester carboxylesterase